MSFNTDGNITMEMPDADDEMLAGIVPEEEKETEPAYAVIFPWFVEALGLLVFFILSRWIHSLPYTAVMFCLGVAMGIGAIRVGAEDQLTESINMWSLIDSEVLLLVFLPGLVFKDALNINFHVFSVALMQILLLAFPMVLIGTVLTACVGFYIFPYNWSWNLSMTFGSILSATDPVAVAALLGEVGAPPRLNMHISGESMLNDGSAMVFFHIFSALFLAELDIEGLGEQFTVAEGFKSFFRLSLGGACIGIAFAGALIFILYMLDRRLDAENNVVQVAATVTVAYLCFYVSEVSSGCSGIIAVVMCGITTRAFGGGFINDQKMMDDFWGLLEHLLNTLLFTLGGAVWGSVVGNTDERARFEAKDWGYLILFYVLIMAIRFVCVWAFYPIVSNIGLKSNWQETMFLWYGGLRGAVGIALSISLDNSVRNNTLDEDKRILTTKLFGMVGGVALSTLIINGITAGPFLTALGLAKSSETTKKISEHYWRFLRNKVLDQYAELVTSDSRLAKTNYEFVKCHVFYLKDISDMEFEMAMQHAQEKKIQEKNRRKSVADILHKSVLKYSTLTPPRFEQTADFSGKELRLLFLELVRAAYEKAVYEGYLDARMDNGYLHVLLTQSLDYAADAVNRGGPIEDWHYTDSPNLTAAKNFTDRVRAVFSGKGNDDRVHLQKNTLAARALVFQEAHRYAREIFKCEFTADVDDGLALEANKIVQESIDQEKLATDLLDSFDQQELEIFISHYTCLILLGKAGKYVEDHNAAGLLKDQEAHGFLEDIDDAIKETSLCVSNHTQESKA